MAQTKTETENRNKALVQAGFDAWKAGTGSPFELLADDANWTIVGNSDAANTYPNKEAFLREVIRPFNARMKEGIKPTIRNLHADGDAVIIFSMLLARRGMASPTPTPTPGSSRCATARWCAPGPSSTAWRSTTFGGACGRERPYCGRGPT